MQQNQQVLGFLTHAATRSDIVEPQAVHFGPYVFEPHQGRLRRGRRVLPLTRKACEVLQHLVGHAGQLVTKDALFQAVWPETAVSDTVLTNRIAELRQVLGDDAEQPRFIATVHRRGYRFVAPLRTPVPATSPAVRRESHGQTSVVPTSPQPAVPVLVGREAALGRLHQLYTEARHGQRRVVFVTGEAGIGKTALVETFEASVWPESGLWLGHGQCIEQYGAGEAYLPLLEALDRLCRGPEGERLVELLTQYAPSWVVQLPGLLSASALAELQHTLAGTTRARMQRELSVALEAASATQPLVLVLEDLHWSDPSTVEALAMLARRREPARLLVVGTYRAAEVVLREHPLQPMKHELLRQGRAVEVALSNLSPAAVDTYVATRVAEPDAAAALGPVVYRRTDGHPLFMVHVTEYLVQERGRIPATPMALGALERALPPSLRELITAQLERLSVEEQQVLKVASVAGPEFAVASVVAGLHGPDDVIETVCARLARRGLFLEERALATWPDGTVSGRYGFRHGLYQDVLYQGLAPGWRARLHQQLGERLAQAYGERAREVAAELAVHFERGQDSQRAVQYLQQAAENAAQRHAHHELVALATKGLDLLAALPETPARAQQELDFRLTLGPALMAIKGYASPEVEQSYARARALCRQISDTPRLFPTLRGLCTFYLNRGALPTARELGEQLVTLAQREAAPLHLAGACSVLGLILVLLGEYTTARTHLEMGVTCTDQVTPETLKGHHVEGVAVTCSSLMALTLWCLGFPAQAVRRNQEALALAQALAQPFSLALAQHWAAFLHYFRHEAPAVQAQAEPLLTVATAQAFPVFTGLGACWQGWALAMQGQGEIGLQQIRQGLAAVLATGEMLSQPLCLLLLTEAVGHTGQVAEGMRLMRETLTACEAIKRGDVVVEAYRLQGELLLRHVVPDPAQAEACFRQALALARRQQAKSWELRAALSLSRLWQQQGMRAEAYELLAPIYAWFTEGFDTADLQEARALLAALA